MSYPLVSIIIPFYNCPYIDQSVASALNQTYPNCEVIVIDDGSTQNQHKLDPFRSRILYFGKANGGTASALNYAMRLSRGDYFAWLSSDDLMQPNRIARQVEYMQPRQALISCTDYHYINAHGHLTSLNVAAKFPTARAFIEAMLTFCPVNGSTVMMHRSLPAHIGYFNEALSCTQDYDYWFRVFLARIDFHYINEPLTLYRWHEGMGTIQKRALAEHEFHYTRDRYAPSIRAILSQPG